MFLAFGMEFQVELMGRTAHKYLKIDFFHIFNFAKKKIVPSGILDETETRKRNLIVNVIEIMKNGLF